MRTQLNAQTGKNPSNSAVEGIRTGLVLDHTSFQSLVENVLDVITELDVKGTILYESPAVTQVLGWKPEEIIGKSVWSLIHPMDVPKVMPVFMLGLLTPGIPHAAKLRFRHADGTWRQIEAVGRSFIDEVLGRRIVVTSRAIVETSENESSISETAIRFGAVVEGLGEGLVITDLDDKILYANGRVTGLLGFTQEEMMGKTPYELLLPEEYWPAYQEFKRKWLEGSAEHCEIQLLKKDRTPAWFFINVNPYLDSSGKSIGIQAALADITDKKIAEEALRKTYGELQSHVAELNREIAERKIIEQELIASRNKAEEMNRLKTAFLANMSHEIRTPMTSILGFASVLSESLVDTELAEFSSMIEKGGRRLMDTINSILDLAKIEANKIELAPALVNVAVEAMKTMDLLRPIAVQKKIALKFSSYSTEFEGMLDVHYLGRILTNIIGNAIKFTERGEVTVTLEALQNRNATEGVVIRVRDTGIGIASDFIPHVFEEFKQQSSGWARNFEGTGLGLTISKQLATLMGGDITVESIQGIGSTFTIELPLKNVQMPIPSQGSPESMLVSTQIYK